MERQLPPHLPASGKTALVGQARATMQGWTWPLFTARGAVCGSVTGVGCRNQLHPGLGFWDALRPSFPYKHNRAWICKFVSLPRPFPFLTIPSPLPGCFSGDTTPWLPSGSVGWTLRTESEFWAAVPVVHPLCSLPCGSQCLCTTSNPKSHKTALGAPCWGGSKHNPWLCS